MTGKNWAGVPDTKMFGGKRYICGVGTNSKRLAKEEARELRKKGYCARIIYHKIPPIGNIPEGNYYAVYVRRKK